MAFKLGTKETPGKGGTSTVSAVESTVAGRVALMSTAKNVPDKKVQKNYTPSFQPMQSSTPLNTRGEGDIGFSAGKSISFGAGVNINPAVEGIRANVGYKNNFNAAVSKTKQGTTVGANASFKNLSINASSASGDYGYKSAGIGFNKGGFSGGVNYTKDTEGNTDVSGGASFNKGNFGARLGGKVVNDVASASVGGMLRSGRATFSANANLTPSRRGTVSGGVTYRF